jgi:OPA family sugar phosphate sensor protein UhpC-like MFS transporter
MSVLSFFSTGPDRPPLTSATEVNRLYKRHRLRIMLAITVGYGLAYPCRLALGMVKKPLIDGGIFSAEQLGIIGAALFYAYGVGKLTNGFLADRANMKLFFAAGMLVSAVINIGMGFSTTLWVCVVLWTVNGWAQAFGSPSGAVAMTQWFSNRERGRIYGIWGCAHSLGEGLTFIGVAAVVTAWGWRAGYWGPGVLGILVAFAIYRLMQDRPQTLGLPSVADWKNDHLTGKASSEDQRGSIWASQRVVLKHHAIWVLAFASALMYVTRYAMDSWGILYLQEGKGYSLMLAGSVQMARTLTGMAGAVAFGFMSDKLFAARRPPVNLIFGILELVGLFMIFFGPPGKPMFMTAGFLLYGFGVTGLVTSLGGLFAIDIAPKKAAGAAMGFIGVFSYVGAALQEWLSGHLIQRGMVIVDGVRHYDFTAAIWLWVGSSVLSLILATTLWRVRLRD